MIHAFESFELDADKFELRQAGSRIAVEPQVLALLLHLAANAHRMVSRDEIIEVVWKGRIVSEAAISSRIKSARQAIGDDGLRQRLIRTIHGKGFRFVGADVIAPAVPRQVSARPVPTTDMTQSTRPSIAVLPFSAVGSHAGDLPIALGIAHDLITELSRLRWLFVIARGSSFRFKAADTDVRVVGRRLGARYCLSGTVSHAGDRITIGVELADTRDRAVIWSDRFSARAGGLDEIRRLVLGGVIAALEIRITAQEAQAAALTSPDRIDAWACYHLGLQHAFRFTRQDNAKAIDLFDRAATLDSQFARAFGGLSFAHFQNAFLGYDEDVGRSAAQARRHAETALSIDPLDPFSNFNMGRAHWLADDVAGGLAWLDRAITLNPNYAQGIYARAWSAMVLCRGDDARRDADAAMLLSPIDPLHYAMAATRALSHLIRGEHHQAALWADSAARSPGAHHLIGVIAVACHAIDGDAIAARAWAERVRRGVPSVMQDDFFRSFPFAAGDTRAQLSAALAAHGI